ncbi:DUF262 domain-containing protein [Lentibacillus saliphilus]|uniref:DUF262 domain-containing protein n=1 Tax=Lentibacillus saliphilus TaxID=2737028 RepID=UPI001C30131A|nr:DUF262 domain-containing protein [Lentibacillus saliphilus]
MAFERPLTINEVINDVHRKKYLLPAIQREFVWDTEQIETLFDSILKGYPVGAFLFWHVNKENIHKFKFYEFLREYHERDHTHNLEANISGEEDIVAILDGQQRLTSLYVGLKGSYAYKLPRKRVDNDLAYPERQLYLNLLQESSEADMTYDFKFLTEEEATQKDDSTYWFKVGDILKFKETYEINDYLYENDLNLVDKEKAKFANKTLFRLHYSIHESLCINYYLEKSQELDKVLNIFIRVNSGGTPLSYSDLLLSIATAQWEYKDARKTITTFVDEINNIGDGFNFNKDMILKTCLVLCDFNDIAFKVDNFDADTMKQIEQEWDGIAQSIRLAVELVSSFGFNYKTLTANYAIIPIAYYLYKKGNPQSFVDSYKFIDDRKELKRFITISLLKRVFGGQPDNVLKPMREIIKNNMVSDGFSFETLKEKLRITNKTLRFSQEEVEDLLWTQYGNRYAFPVLSLLYPHIDYKNTFHQDHIFPKSLLRSRAKLRKQGLDQETIDFCLENHNYIGNLQLIEGVPNMEKSDKPFEDWMNLICRTSEEKDAYMKTHMIPNVELSIENFEAFFTERENMIRERLLELLVRKSE